MRLLDRNSRNHQEETIGHPGLWGIYCQHSKWRKMYSFVPMTDAGT